MRPNHLRPVIISRPDLQSRRQRALFSAITAVAWAVWGYLFLPVLSIVAWWLGLDLFAQYMLFAEDRSYLHTLLMYAAVVGAAAATIIAWSLYNHRRFSGKETRRAAPVVTDEMLLERFELRPEMLELLRRAKVMTLTLDDEGRLTDADDHNEPWDTAARLRVLTL